MSYQEYDALYNTLNNNDDLTEDQLSKLKQYVDNTFSLAVSRGNKEVAQKIYKLCPEMDIVSKSNQHLGRLCSNGYIECAEWLYDICLEDKKVKLFTDHVCATYRSKTCCENHTKVHEFLKKVNVDYKYYSER